MILEAATVEMICYLGGVYTRYRKLISITKYIGETDDQVIEENEEMNNNILYNNSMRRNRNGRVGASNPT